MSGHAARRTFDSSNILQEAETTFVSLEEDSKQVERLVNWFYTGKYNDVDLTTFAYIKDNSKTFEAPDICDKCGYRGGTIVINAEMYGLGDKYGIPALKTYARKRFKKRLDKPLDEDAKCAQPFEKCFDSYLFDFFHALQVVYNTTPPTDRALREVMNFKTAENFAFFYDVDVLSELIRDHPDFGSVCRLLNHSGLR